MTAIRHAAALAGSIFHETWSCARCGRTFDDATSCCAHESQCGCMSHC